MHTGLVRDIGLSIAGMCDGHASPHIHVVKNYMFMIGVHDSTAKQTKLAVEVI